MRNTRKIRYAVALITKTAFLQLIISLIFAIENPNLQAQTYQWAKNMGSISEDFSHGIAVDDSSNSYTVGRFNGIADFDPGPGIFNLISAGNDDVFISKTDANGNFLWAKSWGGISFDYGLSLTLDVSGNIYVTGHFYDVVDFDPGAGVFILMAAGISDIFISKLDQNGNFKWAKKMGGSNIEGGYSVAVDPTNHIYITGRFDGMVDFDPSAGIYNLTSSGARDAFISKLDSNGVFVWALKIGGPGTDQAYDLSTDTMGNIYATGVFEDSADFDPGAGIYMLYSEGSTDIFVLKCDNSGNFIWARTMGGSGIDGGASIVVDQFENVYTTGFFEDTVDFNPGLPMQNLASSGSRDIYILKLDNNGDFVWVNRIGDTNIDQPSDIVLDASGNIYSTGRFSDIVDFDPDVTVYNLVSSGDADIYLTKLDSNGNFIWAKSCGGPNYDIGLAIAVDENGSVYSSGIFNGTADFNIPMGNNLVSTGLSDIFVVKYAPDGVGILENSQRNDFNIYPIPSNGNISIEFGETYGSANVSIVNILGQQIFNRQYRQKSVLNLNLEYEKGLYFITVRDDYRSQIFKVVIQ